MDTQIKEIVAKQLGISIDKITNDMELIKDLNADSLDTVELMMTIEERFGIDFQEDDVEGLSTVQSVIDFVKKFSK